MNCCNGIKIIWKNLSSPCVIILFLQQNRANRFFSYFKRIILKKFSYIFQKLEYSAYYFFKLQTLQTYLPSNLNSPSQVFENHSYYINYTHSYFTHDNSKIFTSTQFESIGISITQLRQSIIVLNKQLNPNPFAQLNKC